MKTLLTCMPFVLQTMLCVRVETGVVNRNFILNREKGLTSVMGVDGDGVGEPGHIIIIGPR